MNIGENNANSKLTEKQVQKIRRDHRRFQAILEKYKHKNMAEKYGISPASYARVIYYDTWVNVEDC